MIELYCDGGASPNPGEGGIGFVAFREGEIILRGYQYLGDNITNNQAEFTAAVNALGYTISYLKPEEIQLYTDSMLVYGSTLNPGDKGYYNIKDPKLVPFHEALMELLSKYPAIKTNWVSRKENALADVLSQRARNTRSSKVLQFGE